MIFQFAICDKIIEYSLWLSVAVSLCLSETCSRGRGRNIHRVDIIAQGDRQRERERNENIRCIPFNPQTDNENGISIILKICVFRKD